MTLVSKLVMLHACEANCPLPGVIRIIIVDVSTAANTVTEQLQMLY